MNSTEQEVVHKRKLKTKIILIVLAILAVLTIAFYIFVWPLVAANGLTILFCKSAPMLLSARVLL